MKGIPQRDAFWNKIYEIAKVDKDVLVVAADMGAPSLDKFRKDLGSQFIDVGIAEQQAVLLGSGLAMRGKKVFAYAIAPFITLRCYEQIKVELAGMGIPVNLVGVGAGFSYSDSGPTHHTVEDLSVLRILPNLKIHNITDSVMASAFAEIACKSPWPRYIRMDRETQPVIYTKGEDFSSGLKVLKKSTKMYIVATGNMVHRALEAADALKKRSVDVGVIDLYTLPIDEKLFIKTLGKVKKIVTIEEHTLRGGMGSAVCEVLMDNGKHVDVKRLGLDFITDYCYKYGGRQNIQSLYGLDKNSIVKSVLDFK
jgi:transketolase